jgi:pyridoxal phosphate enzyme (YggS family)
MQTTACHRTITDNIAKVMARIQQALKQNGRPADSVRLLAISKTWGSRDIREAFEAGIRDFGESYAQEATQKVHELAALPLIWHFIGPIQSNKTHLVAGHFDWLHSLDRLKIAERLSRQRPIGHPPLNICIQINIDREAGKSGIAAAELAEFASRVASLPRLKLRGLMAIPDPSREINQLKCSFGRMQQLFCQLQQQFPQGSIDTLSLGMSADLELAIAAGSTLVRVGTDIFGSRP